MNNLCKIILNPIHSTKPTQRSKTVAAGGRRKVLISSVYPTHYPRQVNCWQLRSSAVARVAAAWRAETLSAAYHGGPASAAPATYGLSRTTTPTYILHTMHTRLRQTMAVRLTTPPNFFFFSFASAVLAKKRLIVAEFLAKSVRLSTKSKRLLEVRS